MEFKIWLENNIRVGSVFRGHGEISVDIFYPSGRYTYTSTYIPIIDKLLRINKYKAGALANELKNMVNKGHATVKKL